MDDQLRNQLIRTSLEARKSAYAPYSDYRVGAALLTADGRIYSGCNIENASFGATNCAERTAFFKAISEGCRSFCAIAVSGGQGDSTPADYAYPCGICRQVMAEFCGGDFEIYIVKNELEFQRFSLSDLLPKSFGGESIQ